MKRRLDKVLLTLHWKVLQTACQVLSVVFGHFTMTMTNKKIPRLNMNRTNREF